MFTLKSSYGTKYSRMAKVKFLKAGFHKIYLVHFWILFLI